jgi:hypothetical protein
MRNPLSRIRHNLEKLQHAMPPPTTTGHAQAISPAQANALYKHLAESEVAVHRGLQVIEMTLDEVSEKPLDTGRFELLSAGDATPLHVAARAGSVAAIRTLIQADPQALDAPDARGRHPLAVAAQYGQLPAMQALVDAGLAVNPPCFYGVTALYYAALARQGAAVDWLRSHGARSASVLTDLLIEKMSEPLVLPPVQP